MDHNLNGIDLSWIEEFIEKIRRSAGRQFF